MLFILSPYYIVGCVDLMRNYKINLTVFGFVFWTVLVASSLAWNIRDNNSHIIEFAKIAARENFNKDQAFRLWGSRHGGVYVAPDERTPPNPALAHIPDRDVITTTGKKLTLMNPAYMLRQMMNEYADLYGVKAKITGRKYLNPINKPDEWELKALDKFDKGIKEVTEVDLIDGKKYLRYMHPMFMEQSCMKCHGHLGFKVGDLRGGVGVAIPLDKYIESSKHSAINLWVGHVIVWLLGVSLIIIFARYIKQKDIYTEQNLALQREVLVAEKISQAKSEFLSRMSHELRTPLNAILGFGQLLIMTGTNLEDKQKQNINEIIDAGNHLLNLINGVLNLSEIESGKAILNIEEVELNKIIDKCLVMVDSFLNKKNITVNNNIGEHNYKVMADSVRLKQVILNLLNNAIKYNNENGSITIRYKIVSNVIRVGIVDTGVGIDVESMERLFEPFERFDVKENIEGTGIGLTIAKELIEMMGGCINVESIKGKGSTFWVELNLKAENLYDE